MNTLKQVIKYTNANAIEATWEDADGIVIKSTAYSGDQMQLFRDDVATYGGNIADYEALIAEVEAAYVPPPPPSIDQIRDTFLDSVQAHIDSVAHAKGYDSGVSCASYATDPHPPFNADAQAFIPWRSSVWLYCYAEWAKLESGQRPMVTVDAFIAELPTAPW